MVRAAGCVKVELPRFLDPMLPQLTAAIEQRLEALTPRAAFDIVFGLSRVAASSPHVELLFRRAAATVARLAPAMNQEELGHICVGYALCGVLDEDLMDAVYRTTISGTRNWLKREITLHLPKVVFAFARLGLQNDGLLKFVVKKSHDMISLGEPRIWGLCALVWSFETLDPDGRCAAFRDLVRKELEKHNVPEEAIARSSVGPDDFRQVMLSLEFRA